MDDPVLASLWRNSRPADSFTITGRNRTNAEVVEIGDDNHLFLLRSLEGYGAQPWTVGINYRLDEVGVEIERLWTTALVGLGILLVSVGTALWIGRAISRQIGRLAAAASSVSALDFKGAPTLPDSRFRELANAADAFNAMVAGLRWFETYVPKGLVLRLIQRDASDKTGGGIGSEERQVTVMFTDIRGFSALAEDLGAAETAALLNSHFSLLSACIEAEGGTVDKFIGDAVMAFWGAPEVQQDHAARALRAAREIAAAIRGRQRQALRRRAAGGPRANRPAQRPGGRRQYRLGQPDQLHDRRRQREHGGANRGIGRKPSGRGRSHHPGGSRDRRGKRRLRRPDLRRHPPPARPERADRGVQVGD